MTKCGKHCIAFKADTAINANIRICMCSLFDCRREESLLTFEQNTISCHAPFKMKNENRKKCQHKTKFYSTKIDSGSKLEKI